MMGNHKRNPQIEYDDFSMKTKLILTRFGGTFGTLRFDENFFLGFVPYWDYKPTFAIRTDNPGVYTSEKILNSRTMDKNHLKCNVIDGSIVGGIRKPIMYSIILNKQPGFKVFCIPETIHYRK